jgi:3-phenylpropionate/cinnamic acid dioxygenase small subunit
VSGERLQWLVDRELVHDVLVRCALAQDAHDWDALSGCFEPDAVYVHPRGRIDGVDGIVERSRVALGALDSSQHLLGSIQVSVDGDEARSTCYFQAQHVREDAPGGPLYVIAGTYRDRMTRRSGQWRIGERVQSYTWRDGNPDVVHR